jgi:hypothetical protein
VSQQIPSLKKGVSPLRNPSMLDFGRREGGAGDLSPRFVRHPGHHTIKRVDENEGEIGKACPIRWQCPGCSHYRPDPSHLPAIEDQVRSLRANLELARAMDATHYTIAGMEGEIADYLKVIAGPLTVSCRMTADTAARFTCLT